MAMGWLLLCALLLSPCSADYMKPPSSTDPAFIKNMVDLHNKFRSEVSPPASNMLFMTWDPALARTAQAWLKKCIYKHNVYLHNPAQCHPTFPQVGENLWIGTHSAFLTSVPLWVGEVKDYNYASNTCSAVCGHYTQVVWADTYKVGCAAEFCKTAEGISWTDVLIVACDYGPTGNYPTQPYATGAACSACSSGDQCVDKLCKNPERDTVKSYGTWRPPWASGAASGQSNVYSGLSYLTFIFIFVAYLATILYDSFASILPLMLSSVVIHMLPHLLST